MEVCNHNNASSTHVTFGLIHFKVKDDEFAEIQRN